MPGEARALTSVPARPSGLGLRVQLLRPGRSRVLGHPSGWVGRTRGPVRRPEGACSAGRFQMARSQASHALASLWQWGPLPSKPGIGLWSSGDLSFQVCPTLLSGSQTSVYSIFFHTEFGIALVGGGGGEVGEKQSFVIFNSCYKISTLWALKILFS